MTEAASPAREPYDTYLALGRDLVRRRLWAEAETALARALKLKPSGAEASMLLAQALKATSRWEKAEKVYARWIKHSRGLGLPHLELGLLQRERGRLAAAYHNVCVASESPDTWLEGLLERVSLDLAAGRFAAAVEIGERLLAKGLRRELCVDKLMFPFGEMPRPPFTRTRLARVRVGLEAHCREHLDQPWGLLWSLSLAVMLDPEIEGDRPLAQLRRVAVGRYAWMRSLIGAVYQRRADWRSAMREFAAVVRAHPRFMRPKFLIGDGYLGLGRPREALSLFLLAKPLDADQQGKWLAWMGEVMLRLGRYDEALQYLEQACADGSVALAVTWRGAVKQRLGRLDEALLDLDEGVRRSPRDVEPYNWRAENLRLRGSYDRALEDADRALEIFPGDLCACMTRALVYFDLGRFDELRREHNAVREPLLGRWGRALAKVGAAPGASPAEMRAFLTAGMGLLENWLRAHDSMPEPLTLALLEERRP